LGGDHRSSVFYPSFWSKCMSRKSLMAAKEKRANRSRFMRPMLFESLESRRVLTCSIDPPADYDDAAEVSINCNSGSDTVRVTSNHNGTVSIKVGNNASWVVNRNESLEVLNIDLGGGSNRLLLDFANQDDEDTDTGPAGLLNFPEIHVIAGSGADRVDFDFAEESDDGTDDNGRGALTLTFDLGSGNDVLTVHSADDVNGLYLRVDTGDGADKVTIDLDSNLDDYADIGVDLGTGNDKFLMTVGGDVNANWYGPATCVDCEPVEFTVEESECEVDVLTPVEQDPSESQDLEDILDGFESEEGDSEDGAAWFNGDTGNDLFTISIEGSMTGTACTVADLGSGNDSFVWTVGGELSDVEFSFDVQGGSGNDTVILDLGSSAEWQGPVHLTGNLGAGNDIYSASIGNGCSDLCVSLFGQAGNDQISIAVNGDVGGDANIYIDTGTNGDTVTLEFGGDLSGETNIAVLLGSGNNSYTLQVAGDIADGDLYAEGGSGKDNIVMDLQGDANGDLDITAITDGGNDTYSLTVEGDVDFNLYLDMGSGTDNGWLEFNGDINGDFDIDVRMGVGNDNLTVTFGPDSNISEDLFDAGLIHVCLDGDDEANETDDGIDCLWLTFEESEEEEEESQLQQNLLVDLALVNWECIFLNGVMDEELPVGDDANED
jgi:hypothetical protein